MVSLLKPRNGAGSNRRWPELGAQPIALFLHKPLFLDHPSEPDFGDATLRQSCIDAVSRARLLDLCKRHGVRLVSSGHKHQTRSFSLDGIYYLWAPSTACVNGPPTTLHWGVREVGLTTIASGEGDSTIASSGRISSSATRTTSGSTAAAATE